MAEEKTSEKESQEAFQQILEALFDPASGVGVDMSQACVHINIESH